MAIDPRLQHRTIYEDLENVAVSLPLIPELQSIHPQGYFPLLENPQITQRAIIFGMFVLRPRSLAWTAPILQDGQPTSLYEVPEWICTVKGLEGGWLIANGNLMDAYRLALQYELSDAVIVGSQTLRAEGTSRPDHQGYIWHPYTPAHWGHLYKAAPDLLTTLQHQRETIQGSGHLSSRRYPAQIVVSRSGKATPPPDLLEADIFHKTTPEGDPIEAYILTSQAGADKLRARAATFDLARRIEQMLMVLSPDADPHALDLKALPDRLYRTYDIRLVNHDGGATVLSAFSQAGILPQLNLTLTRKQSIKDVLETTNNPRISAEKKDDVLNHLIDRTQCFFRTPAGTLPSALQPVSIMVDAADEAAVVIFDAREFVLGARLQTERSP